MVEELRLLFENHDYEGAAEFVRREDASDVAAIIAELDEQDVLPFARALDSDFLADIMVLLDSTLQQKLIAELHDDELQEVMEDISVDDTVEIMEDMPTELIQKIAEEDEILKLLEEKKFNILKPLLAEMNEIDLAEVFESAKEEDLPILFRILPKDLAAEVFVELDSDTKQKLLIKLSDKEIKAVMDELFLDDTVDLVEEMPANVVKRLLALSDVETRAYVNEILKYPKDSAGSIMTIEFVSLRPDMTVEMAFNHIRETAIDKETIYTCYVTDETSKLIGLVTAKDLMLAKNDAKIGDIMEDNVIYAHTLDDKEDVARKISDYGFLAIPITDRDMRLVGIVTVDDAIDVLQAENTEDITKMAAIVPDAKPYLKTSVFSVWKNRIPWLLVLMISATFTGLIINKFETKLNAISPVLFACVPMLMDTGGNSGSQASVTVIRSLALGELSTSDFFKVMWKEFRSSLLIAATLAVACFAKLMIIDKLIFGFDGYTPGLCAVVTLAMFVTVVLAKFVGCILPMVAKKLKLDPAAVASPFITTIVDAVSLILFCLLSVAILG